MWPNVILLQNLSLFRRRTKFFSGLDVDVIEGHWVLGSVIGFDESCNDFLKEKSVNYSNMLEIYERIATQIDFYC